MFIQSILLLILKILYKKTGTLNKYKVFYIWKVWNIFFTCKFLLKKSSIYYNISLLINALYVSVKKLVFFCGKFLSNIDVTNIDVTSKC